MAVVRRWGWVAAIGGVLVLGVLVIGRPRAEGAPLDPDATGPLGTRALVVFLEELGAEVEVTGTAPGADDDVALVLGDDLDDVRRAEVIEWVEAGGTVVVADPASPLHPFEPVAPGLLEELDTGCAIPALAAVEEVQSAGGLTFRLLPGDEGCFRAEGGSAFVAVRDLGAGTVVAIGGAGALTNGTIGDADNGLLAAALLAPSPGTRVSVLRPPPPGAGPDDLFDLIGDGVRAGLWQLAIAFGLYALWRSRRLGRPVPEDQPVELAASDLVAAVGALLQQAGRSDSAGNLVGSDVRRRLAERLGLPAGAEPEVVAEVASSRTGIPLDRVRSVLLPGPVPDDEALVALAAGVEALRSEVVDG